MRFLTLASLACCLVSSALGREGHPNRLDLSSPHPTPPPTLQRRAQKCSQTSDCSNTPPKNANKWCNTKSGVCSWRCRTGFTQNGSTCVLTSTSTTKAAATTSRPASTTSRRMTTTTASASTCAPTYTGAATTIRGTGTLPKPTAFVKRSGTDLTLSGRSYRIVGPNIYWLCQDENFGPIGSYTDKGRVREALAIAVAMGANTIRVLSCGISVGTNNGNTFNLEPTFNDFNLAALDIRDYVLYAAREYGIRVIMTMTDNYQFYHGGKYNFLDFVGASTANGGAAFYTNQNAIAAYKTYLTKFLTRTNSYTGVKYVNDPTIIAWETGNELGGYINAEMYPPASWTKTIIDTIRTYDKNHLIIDGSNGFWNYSTNAVAPGLDVAGVDIMSDHGYPRNTGILEREIELADDANKAFFVGEYDWRPNGGGVPLTDYLSFLENNQLGDQIWSLFGHDPQCCAFVQHNDGYSIYYPNGNSATDQAAILQVVQHWYRVTGRTVPTRLPAVACPQPIF
ncbi:hypothetical protein JCM8097_008224 [Rhodosporidiobolus ruineniae]